MALTPAAFLLPVGHVNAAHFPLTEGERAAYAAGTGGYASEDQKASVLLDAWIMQAEALHPADEALQAAYVEAVSRRRAYESVLAMPAQASAEDGGSYRFTDAQLARLAAAADAAEVAYAVAVTPETTTGLARRGSVVVDTVTLW